MSNVNPRYKDVLIALNVANTFNQELGRLQLQKYIYLADTISVIWAVLSPKVGHETYKRGPYDYDIQNAVDTLAFRGFVDVTKYYISPDGDVEANYRINPSGMELFAAIGNHKLYMNRISLYESMGVEINKRDWKDLKKLVYAEPTYMHSRANGWGHRFDYASLLKNDSLRILFDFEKMQENKAKMSKENFISIFFRLLD